MRLLTVIVAICLGAPAWAGKARVAVAANFLTTAERLARGYGDATGDRIELVSGSTGALYAQIAQGAPYDLFLSADRARIGALDADGLIAGRRVYALGVLVLWSPDRTALLPGIEPSLALAANRRFAMADPAVAPYGRAAVQALAATGQGAMQRDKAVIGTSVGQAFALVATGNAQLGFLALSQVQDADGAWYVVPDVLYDPIEQEAGLLTRGAGNPAARGFFDWLDSDDARAMIAAAGYRIPAP